MIEKSLLIAFGAKNIVFEKGQIIFNQGETARYYYQLISGTVKMNNFNDEGKEFIQGIFSDGQSFGEPPLFLDDNYPANAVAISKSVAFQLSKEKFFEILNSHPDAHLSVTVNLAKRLYFKSVMASEISSQDPEHRVLKLIDYFKYKINNIPEEIPYKVEITRQQIADLTGLRVETIIRAIKSLERKGEITIKDRKVLR